MIKEYLKKKAWVRRAPMVQAVNPESIDDVNMMFSDEENIAPAKFFRVTQDMLWQEFDPNSHDINNPAIYKDKEITDKEGKFVRYEPATRVSIPMQKLVAERQTVHLFANDILLTQSSNIGNDVFEKFKTFWSNSCFDDCLKSTCLAAKSVGDAASVMFIKSDGTVGFETMSYLDGYTIYPVFDDDKELEKVFFLFNGDEHREAIEYNKQSIINYLKNDDIWVVNGKEVSHGLGVVPAVYLRLKDVPWAQSQELINTLERTVSDFRDSNGYFSKGILFLSAGETGGIDIKAKKETSGVVITGGKGAQGNLIEQQNLAPGFAFEYKEYFNLIKHDTGLVLINPEDFKGGDVSGAAMKAYYDPAVQKALLDIPVMSKMVQNLISIAKVVFIKTTKGGLELNKGFIKGEIDIYVPRNSKEEMEILQQGVKYGIVSKETASRKHKYVAPDEFNRINKQQKEEDEKRKDIEFAKIERITKGNQK